MKKDKILKSSLSTLLKRFSNTDVISSLSNTQTATMPGQIPIEVIKDNYILKRARINDKVLNKVSQDIIENGISTPLYVRKDGDVYETIYPRLLYKAARKAKLNSIPCLLLSGSEDDLLLFLAARLLQSKDSNIIEMSLLFNAIKKKLKYSQKEIAAAMNLSRSQVTNIMRLIKMPDYILDDISDGKITFGHVRAISTLNEEQMKKVMDEIYEKHLSVHDVEKIVYQKKHNINFENSESKLKDKYLCDVKSSAKRVSFIFDSEEEKQKFIDKLLKK